MAAAPGNMAIRNPITASRAEAKPAWQSLPRVVRAEAERLLGSRVRRAQRTWGGYAPSATFRLALEDGRTAFMKAAYPRPADSPVVFVVDREERIYRDLHRFIAPWAPAFYGSFALRGWHGLLLEDLGPPTVPPWTAAKARAAMEGYAAMHRASFGARLPHSVPRDRWRGFAFTWERLHATSEGTAALAALAGPHSADATRWLTAHHAALDRSAQALARQRGPYALLHLDTRSDNIRVHPGAAVPLRIFDWPFACAGPPELDLMAFVQSIVCEGGPDADTLVQWYARQHAVRERVLASSAAAVAGFFAEHAWQPEVPALPRLRSVQRHQLKASLASAARLLQLPTPDWLATVPD